MEQLPKYKSLINTKSEEESQSLSKKLNFKGKQISFSQPSEISEDTKEGHKLFSPVSIYL